MTRFMRFCAFLSVLFFASNVFAAGYTCSTTKTYTSCNANYYLSSGTCTKCPSSYPYSDGGTGGIAKCYKNATKTGSQLEPATPSGCASKTTSACTPGTCTYKDYYSGTDGTCTPTNCTKTISSVTASANYYVSGTTCKTCSSYSSTYTKSDGGSISSSSCYTNITRGCTQNNGSTPSGCASVTAWNSCSCAGGTYKKYASGSTSGTTSNETCTKTPKTVTASSNYYVSGTTCPSCSSYSSTYTKSDGGSISSSSCYTNITRGCTQNNGSTPSGCASVTAWNSCSCAGGTYKKYASGSTSGTTSNETCTKTPKTVTASANYYVSGTTCPSCSSFSSTYTKSDGGSIGSGSCYVSRTNTGSQLACSQPSNSVSYTCGTCSPGTCTYKDYYSATDTTCTPTNCTKPVASATCKANYYGTTSCTACSSFNSSYPYSDQGTTSSNYCYASKTNTGSQLACSQPSNSVSYTCGTCSPGTCSYRDYYNATDTTCTPTNCTKPVASATCKANYYGTTSCTACDSSYPYSDQGTTSSNYCYASKTNTGSQLACSQPSNSVSYTCGTCSPGTCTWRDYKNATDTTCTPSNCTKPVASATCNANYYGTTSCTACPSNSSSAAGSDARADCSCNAGYGGDATTGSCTICAAGSYKSSAGNASCGTCTAGYYCTGGTNRTACPSPTTYAPNSFGAEYYSPSVDRASVTSGTGKSAATQCQALYWYTSSRGKFYEYSMYSSSTGRYVASQIGGWHAVNAGYYLTTKAGCGAYAYYSEVKQCPAGSYCPGKTSVVCNSSNQATVHTTNFGLNTCPSGYDTSAAGSDAASDCYISVAAGKYVGTANSATLSNCAGGTYKAAHSVAYGSTSSCATCSAGYYCPEGASSQTACGGNNKYSSSGASACSTVSSGYYTTGGGSTTRTGQTKCEAGNYCSGGVKTACGGGKYSAAGASSCGNISAGCYGTSASSSCPAVCAANTYSNAGASSCSSCPTDYKNSGDTAASHAGSASCIITVSGGYYIGTAGDNSSNWDKCAGGTYKASHTVAYGSTSSCSTCSAGYYCPEGASSQTACGGNTKFSSSGASSCSTVSSGYYSTGGTSTTRTGQTKCEAGNYCSGGVKTACGGGKYSAAGATSCTNITAGCYGTSASSACPAVCAANTYSNAGASACTSCDSDYANSGTDAASHAGVASCKVTCAAGTYVASANAACTDVGSGYYTTASQTISQGSTGSRSACSSLNAFYTASDSGRNATPDCYGTTSSGKFVKTAKSGEETCTAGGYCAGSVKVYYNSTGGRTACGAGKYNASTGSSASSACTNITAGCYGTSASSSCPAKCAAGKYSAAGSASCTDCGGGKYSSEGSSSCSNITAGCYGTSASSSCPAVCAANTYSNAGASSCSSCPTDYNNSGDTAASHAGSASCIITVSGGYYIGTAGDNSSNWDTCACGTYKASHTVAYGSTSSCATTDAGYYAAAGASSQTKATAGYYAAAGACSQTACSGRTKYSAAGAASCSTVSTGYYTTGCNSSSNACTGQTICAKGTYCSSGVAYNCPGGTYGSTTGLSSNACSGSCTAGYYCPAGSTSATQNACATNATSAAGSDAISDCVCKAGYSGDASTSSGTCTACACGTYKSGTGNTSCTTTTAGYYATGTGNTGQTKATAGNYAAAGACSQSSCADLGGGLYSSSAAGSDATADCYATVPAGKYLSSATSTSFTTCTAGYYCAGKTLYYNSTGGRTGCGAGKYSASGSDASSDCASISAGCYGTSASSACPAKCAAGTYSTGGASACTNCANKPDNSSYTSATGNTSASCPWTCNSGYNQTADNQCGQFCGAGITHLHLGNGVSIPLYSSARTSPAINVKWNNTVCYGSLESGNASGLNVKVGTTTYHAVN